MDYPLFGRKRGRKRAQQQTTSGLAPMTPLTSRQRALMMLAFGGLTALATSLWAYQWLQSMAEQTRLDGAADHRTTPVAVATADLSWGMVLTDEAVRIAAFPADAVSQGHFPSVDTLKGRVLIADIKQHEPILESKLAPTSVTVGGVAAVTHPEKRAVAVKIDDVVAVGGFIKPGDRVDVLATLRRPGETDAPVTKVVLENIRVLAMGEDTERAAQAERTQPKPSESAAVPTVMTLEVTPAEAEQLALASTEGKVQLALRNPQSVTAVYTSGATIPSLLALYGGEGDPRSDRSSDSVRRPHPSRAGRSSTHAPTPASAPKGASMISVELIRGLTRNTLTFEPTRSDATEPRRVSE